MLKIWKPSDPDQPISLLMSALQTIIEKLYTKIGLCFNKIVGVKELTFLQLDHPKVRFRDEITSSYLLQYMRLTSRLEVIHREIHAENISLLYLISEKQKFSHGFECNGTDYTPLVGIDSFPVCCSFPQDVPT